MARGRRGEPPGDSRLERLLRLRRSVQVVTMGAIVVFIVLSLVLPPEFGRFLFPLVLGSLAAFTIVSGYVAVEAGVSGIGAVDARPGWARWMGILWIFAGFFLAIFALSYFFV